jgi:hypothetical protein
LSAGRHPRASRFAAWRFLCATSAVMARLGRDQPPADAYADQRPPQDHHVLSQTMITSEGRDEQLARSCRCQASRRAVAVPPGLDVCLTVREDEVFEPADALLCADGPVRNLASLSLAPGHRCCHGALDDAVNQVRIDTGLLRRALAGLPLPRAADGWLTADAGGGCLRRG